MSRILGPKCKLARRVGRDLQLKSGARSLDSKCKLNVPPGMHGAKRVRKSDYAMMMDEKQAMRYTYGVSEKQFKRYYRLAAAKRGATGELLLSLLESRLDNIVFRMGFAVTRAEARQLVNHRAVLVNDKMTDIPSYLVKVGDVVRIAEKSKGQLRIQSAIKEHTPIDWIFVDIENLQGTLKSLPALQAVGFNLNLIIAFYSK